MRCPDVDPDPEDQDPASQDPAFQDSASQDSASQDPEFPEPAPWDSPSREPASCSGAAGLPEAQSPSPTRDITVKSLTADRLNQAFPLIQAIAPNITLEAWKEFALPLVPRSGDDRRWQGGILIVEDGRGYISGLVAYRVQRDLLHGPVLVAEHFVAFDFFERDRIAEALARALEGLAAGHRCAAIHTVLPEGAERGRRQWLIDMLKLRGHQPHRVALHKPMAQKAAGGQSASMPSTR